MGYSGSEAPERRTSEEGYTRSSFGQLFSSSRPLIQAIHSRNSRTNIWENNLNFKKLVTHYRTYQLINCQVLVERRKGNPINENVICMVTNSSVCLYLSSKRKEYGGNVGMCCPLTRVFYLNFETTYWHSEESGKTFPSGWSLKRDS